MRMIAWPASKAVRMTWGAKCARMFGIDSGIVLIRMFEAVKLHASNIMHEADKAPFYAVVK